MTETFDSARITSFDAIVLAGGRAARMGGLRKPDLVVRGQRLLDTALAAVRDARQVIVVGDVEVPDGVLRTREDPPFGGPVAGVDAGFAALSEHSPWTLILASDLPGSVDAVARLLSASVPAEADGICLLDADGRLQWLLGCYRTPALRRRLTERGDPPLTAMHRLLAPLELVGIPAEGVDVTDVDTPEDLDRWNATDPRSTP